MTYVSEEKKKRLEEIEGELQKLYRERLSTHDAEKRREIDKRILALLAEKKSLE